MNSFLKTPVRLNREIKRKMLRDDIISDTLVNIKRVATVQRKNEQVHHTFKFQTVGNHRTLPWLRQARANAIITHRSFCYPDWAYGA